jgi:hypothetical protein
MDMRRILQTIDSASNKSEIISEGKGPLNRATAAESIAMQHYAEPIKKTITNPVLNVQEGATPSMIGKYFKAVEEELNEAAERSKDRSRQLAERVATTVNELSNDTLASYKKKASADATAADKAGDFERANKRFRGITKATIKQFDNDIKKHTVDEAEGEPEGVAHLTKELLTHIVQQSGKEGAHAVVKSLTWGDGAAKELLHLIVDDLKDDIKGMDESNLSEIAKGQKDSNGFTKCWPGKHAEGTKKSATTGKQVRNCVPNEGMAEDEGTTKKYEMMLRNGQVKRFVAKDDADAKRIAAGHGAKSVIRMKSNVPGDKIGEQGVAENFVNYQGLRPPKNVPGTNLFPGQDIVGQRVYHCTNSLEAIKKSGGLKPRRDATGEREYGRLSTDEHPFIPVIGIWFSVGKPNWVGKHCVSFVIEPTDQVYVAYANTKGLKPNVVLNPIALDRLTVEDRQGVAEGPTDDPRFQKMMGKIQKSTPTPMSGYVALSFASEGRSKKIKGVKHNGKPMPDVIDDPEEFLGGNIEFTPDQIEQKLMAIGEKYGWDSIDPGQGQGYTEMFFDTSREYTSKNQSRLAANIVRTVNEINKFFNSINRSLQSTGLPGYTTDVWQGMGPSDDINQIEDLTQIISIAKKQGIEEGDSGAKYRVKSIGRDAKGDYYISPSTEKKVYKSGVNKGDHENPNTGEIKKKVAEAGREGKDLDKIRDKYNKYDEAANPAQQAAIAIAKKKAGKK